MAGIHSLSLEEAHPLNDNPQNRSLVKIFEEDSKLYRKYMIRLAECSQQLIKAQAYLASATSNLSEHLKLYEVQKFPLDSDEDSIVTSTIKQFSRTVDNLSTYYQVISTQLQDGMLFPLSKFINADLKEIDGLSERYHSFTSDHEQLTSKYCKLSKKKENEKQRQELNQEFYNSSKKLHDVSLNYYTKLNSLQYQRKIAIIEPLIACIHAYKSHFSIGNSSMSSEETNNFLANIGESVQGVYSDMHKADLEMVKQSETLIEENDSFYYAEENSKEIHPNTALVQKSGYLFIKSKFAGMMSKWDRIYLYTQNGNLMHISQGEIAGMLLMELKFQVIAQHLENEDRRCIFQISDGKKSVVLQALNVKERDEWIATIRNIIKEESFAVEANSNANERRRSSAFKAEKYSSSVISVPKIKHSSFSEHLSLAKSGPPPTPPCSPMDGLNLENPIQFDFLGQNECEVEESAASPVDENDRVNPFDQAGRKMSVDGIHLSYVVRLLGSTDVHLDRGDKMIYDTIRQVMAARAIYNVFKMTDTNLDLSANYLRIIDPISLEVRISFPMHDICSWGAHNENNKLFGFIVRNKSPSSLRCYIFESNVAGDEICASFSRTAQLALQNIIEKKPERNPDAYQSSEDDPTAHSSTEAAQEAINDLQETELKDCEK